MDVDWDDISHVTKVDPAEPLPDDLGVLGGTDLVIVGGSDGVTESNSLETIERITNRFPELPVFQEPYSADHVSRETIESADYLSIPAVFNGDRDHFVGKHVELFTEVGEKPSQLAGAGLPVVGELIASKGREAVSEIAAKVFGEGYVVQHVDSAAAATSGVVERYSPEQVAGAALATETFYGFPIFYVEYSGTYGGPEDVAAAAEYLTDTVLLYGGGVDSRERTTEILEAGADAVVVGDAFHEDPEGFRRTIPDA